MRYDKYESPVTVILRDRHSQEATCSALLEQDPAYLSWNRMSLVGCRADEHPVWRLEQGQVNWELCLNPQWPAAASWSRTKGVAFIRSLGGARGVTLAEDGIRKFADLGVQEHTETTTMENGRHLAVEYWFLQRPRDWIVSTRRPSVHQWKSRRGSWIAYGALGLKLRVAIWGHTIDDRRRSAEVELITLPGVEIQPIGKTDPQMFAAAATRLWFSVRILITFWHRQHVSPVVEFLSQPNAFTETWRAVAMEPPVEYSLSDRSPLYGRFTDLLSKGVTALAGHEDHRELLHAAVYGYALSYQAENFEMGLTSCMEAIERLVCVIEEEAGVGRAVVEAAAWNPVRNDLRRVIRSSNLTKDAKAVVKRSLSSPPGLTLEERVRRVFSLQGPDWTGPDAALADGLTAMITARNAIVHGRLPADYNELYGAVLRARAIFQVMFLNFLGCRTIQRDGWADMTMSPRPGV